jgi:hypothetical protein
MALKRRTVAKRKDAVEGDYQQLEDGDYESRLVYVADLGLHKREYMGEDKGDTQKISLGFEILGNPVQIDGEMKPRILWTKPFNVYTELNERGEEMKYYRIFNPSCQEGDVANWESVLGEPCSLTVGKNWSKDKTRTFDTILSIAPIPAKYRKDVPEGEITPAIGNADDVNDPVQKAMFGLVLYVFKNRLTGDDVPF